MPLLNRLFPWRDPKLPDRIATFLEIASSNSCNLSCVYCYGLGHPEPARLDSAKLGELLDLLLPRVEILVPSAGSEPFSSDISLSVSKVIQHNRRMLLITNGTFPMAETVHRLGERLYRLQVSVDSHIPALYERLRPGARYETVEANLRDAVRLLRHEVRLHRLVVSIVLTRDNAPSVADTVRHFADLGVEAFLIQELYEFDPRLVPYRPSASAISAARSSLAVASQETNVDILFANVPVQRMNGRPSDRPPFEWDPERVRIRMREYPGQCWQAWEWLKIHPAGDIHPCCVAPPELVLGNLARETPERVLSNGLREKLQRQFEAGNPPEVCRNCPLKRQIEREPQPV